MYSNVRLLCHRLFTNHVTDAGFLKPASFSDIEFLITQSGASLHLLADAPQDLLGVQIGNTVYVNASPLIPEWRRIRIAAHEWCHWLRRDNATEPMTIRFYYGEAPGPNAGEEIIAREFESLFDIR